MKIVTIERCDSNRSGIVGFRFTFDDGSKGLFFLDQGAMPGVRAGDRFSCGHDETLTYEELRSA